MNTLEREQVLPLAPADAFSFFADALNLQAITPPWLHFRVVTPGPIEMREGAQIAYRLRLRGLPLRWLTRIDVWEPGLRFVDSQLRGPYRFWSHAHSFRATEGGTLMTDVVRYSLPLGPLGRLIDAGAVRGELDRIFDFRRDAIAARLGRA